MDNLENKTREQLLKEINLLKAKIAELGKFEIERLSAEQAGKRAEEVLQDSEQRYRRILEASLQGMYQVDAKGRITFANPLTAELTGYSLEELDGLSLDTLFLPGEAKAISDANVALLYSGKPIVGENTLTRKDGSQIETYFSCAPVFDESGMYTGFVGSILDITERKHAEKELSRYRDHLEELVKDRTVSLKESEERFRSLFNNNRDDYIFVMGNGEILDANPRMLEMLGYSIDELRMKNFWKITPEKWVEREYRVQGTLLFERGYTDLYEKEYIRKDGTVFPIEVQAFILEKGEDIESSRIGGFVRDITERRKAEEALKKRDEFVKQSNKDIVTFTQSEELIRADFEESIRKLTELAALTLNVERVSVWLYNEDQSKILCQDLYELSREKHTKGYELTSVEYPAYFRALKEERTIPANDALNDPRTREFSDSYLKPLNILSMLDASIISGGFLIGVVCHENIGYKRDWTTEEQNYAGSMADLVALAREASERRRAEQALRESESKYRLLAENAVDFIFYMDLKLKFIYMSPYVYNSMGYYPEELIGTRLFKYTSRKEFIKIARVALGTVKNYKSNPVALFETKLINKKGEEVPVEISGRIVLNEKGKPIGLQGNVRDITDRKQVEEREKHLIAVLKAIRNVNQIIIQEKNCKILIKKACENFVEARGFQSAWIALFDEKSKLIHFEGEDLDKNFNKLKNNISHANLPKCINLALQQDDVVLIKEMSEDCLDCPIVKIHKGKNRSGMARSLKYGGKCYGVVSVSLALRFVDDKEEQALFDEVAGDIAYALYNIEVEEQRKLTQKKLAEKTMLLDNVINRASNVAIATTDLDLRITSYNPIAQKFFGYTREEVL